MLDEVWLTGPGVSFPNDQGVYLMGGQPVVQIVRGGDAVPGGGPDEVFQLPQALAVNDSGMSLICAATSAGGASTGLWLGDGQGLITIARQDQPAPGAGDGWVFSGFDGASTLAYVDTSGRVYFGTGIKKDGSVRYGVWTWDHTGGVTPVVVPGETVEATPGDQRTIYNGVLWPQYQNRAPEGINDHGQVAVYIVFDNDARGAVLAEVDSPACAPDCDANGVLNLFDFLCYVNLFNAGGPAADCTADGVLDLFDFLCVVNAFNIGCG